MSANPDTDRSIFLAAIDIASKAEREAFVARACGDNAQLQADVQALLAAHGQSGDLLDAPDLSARTYDSVSERPGTKIGPYKLLQQIGEGGFGVVFMAEQLEPVRRKVALKVIKPGMDTRQVIARFEAERQALAVMDHPNIARVLDAGATESGRPYFVMELVRGTPITHYCDENQLSVRERLALFALVCQAIQHAHTKGIIHRDIKPTNVLVTRQDGQPVVKVIDFGIAKAMGQQLTDKTLFTDFAQMIGTPLYMSPEQAELSGTDADTRSDVYSLGVLLYELLTGSTPVSKEQLKQAAFDEIRRIIREDEPPKPSTRISTAEAAPSIAAQRHTEPAKLAKLVRGELDWIVMKALEKDRSRRYETANGFAQEVQRYLADEPVQACPPSAAYRFRKFARRNKAALAMASVLAGALMVAVVALSVSNWLVARERDQKTKALSDKVQALGNESAALKKAKAQEGVANERAEEAKKQQTIAKDQELLARRRFYAAQGNLAQQAWEAGQPARALELLESQRPRFDQEDLRGFDWYYLWRLCHRNLHRTLSAPGGEPVYSLAITPDGTTLASGCGCTDPNVTLWDVATGKERAVLGGHNGLIWRLAISPRGDVAASASMDNTVKLWDLGTSELLATLTGRNAMARSTAFSPDGNILAVGTESGALEFWDVAARKRRLTLQAHFAPAIALAYSPDGKMLVTGAGWNTSKGPGGVKVWDVTSEPPQVIFPAYGSWFAVFSPDSKLLATCDGSGAKLWSVPSGQRRATFESPSSSVKSLAFSADGNTLVLGCHDRTVKLWEFATGATRTVGVHLGQVHDVAFFPQGDLVASTSDDGTVKVWRTAPLEGIASFAHDNAIRCLAFTPDSKLLVVGSDTTTMLLDAATGENTTTLPVGDVVRATSADANLLAAWGAEGKCKVWDVAAAQVRAELPIGPNLVGVTLSQDGKTLVAWTGEAEGAGRVRLWDLSTSRVRHAIEVDDFGKITGAVLSPDGTTLAIAAQFGVVTLSDPATGQRRMTLNRTDGPTGFARGVVFSNDGRLLAAGNDEGLLRVWNVESGQLKASFKGHSEAIRSVAFSPDGKTLLSGSIDKTARLWDVATGQELLTLKDHKFPVHLVAFAPGGKRLATASHNVVKLWLAATEPEATAFRRELDHIDPASPGAAIDWGDRLQQINRPQEAAIAYGTARDRLEKLAAALPDEPEYQARLAYALLAPSLISDPLPSASQTHRQFLELWQTLPADQQDRLLDALNKSGVAHANGNRLDRSIPILEETVRLHRTHRPEKLESYRAIANLGVSYWKAGRRPEGTALVEEVALWAGKQPVPVASQFDWAADWLAAMYEQETQFAKAEQLLREFLQRIEQDPASGEMRPARLLAALGRNLLKQQKYAAAETALRQALQLEPAHPTALASLNRALAGQGKPPEEPPPPPQVVKSPAELAEEQLKEGRSLSQQKKFVEAEAALREAVRLNAGLSDIHDALGWVLREQSKNAEAELAFREAVRLGPDLAGPQSGLGWALYSQGKFTEAAEVAGEVVRLKPESGHAHLLLGWALLNCGKPAEAELALRECARLKPDDASGHHGLGSALFNQKKYREAIEQFRAVLKLGVTDHWVHDLLGWSLVENGQATEAEDAFREVVRLKPELAPGYFGLARALVDQKRFAEAEIAARQALRLDPSHPYAGELLRQALVGQGKNAEADELVKKRSEDKEQMPDDK